MMDQMNDAKRMSHGLKTQQMYNMKNSLELFQESGGTKTRWNIP